MKWWRWLIVAVALGVVSLGGLLTFGMLSEEAALQKMASASEADKAAYGQQYRRLSGESSGPQQPYFTQNRHILVFQSYHSDMPWVEGIEDGLRHAFQQWPNVVFYYEYMDSKRHIGEAYWEKLHELYTEKYKDKRYDLIVAADDIAYQFMLQHGEQLFPQTPIVFCGVNDFSSSAIRGRPITGVIETLDMKESLQTALQLHPRTRQVVIINDETIVGRACHAQLAAELPSLPQEIEWRWLERASMEEVRQAVASLPPDSLIFLLTFNVDRTGQVYTYEEAIRLIAPVAPVPIYSVWDLYLGNGIVGGKLTTGYEQGLAAGKLGQRLLLGETAANLPPLRDQVNRYLFDAAELARWQIEPERLPAGSVVVNKPVRFYDRYRLLVWGILAVFSLLSLLLILLAVTVRKRRRSEAKVRQLNSELEARVQERTAALQASNEELSLALTDLQNTRKHLVESEKMAALGELVAGVAHEINTPVGNSITAATHLSSLKQELEALIAAGQLKRSDLERYLENSDKAASIIFINLQRAAELIRSFKQVAVDQSVEEQRAIVFADYLAEIMLSLRPQLKKTKLQVVIDCEPALAFTSYPGVLWQVFSNFVMNSILHGYPGEKVGTLRIQARRTATDLALTYSDDGCGMSEEVRRRIFEPFFTTRRGEGGSGLGLHIVYNLIVFKLGGTITCDSQPGQGTTFHIRLPLTSSPVSPL